MSLSQISKVSLMGAGVDLPECQERCRCNHRSTTCMVRVFVLRPKVWSMRWSEDCTQQDAPVVQWCFLEGPPMVHRVESQVTNANPATTVQDADTDPVVHHRDSGGQRHASTMTQPAEDARLRPISTSANSTSTSASWPKSNWPKSKLAEVEINWPKSNRWCLLCFFFLSFFFFFICFVFLLFFTFFLFLLISLFILFLFCFCFRPQKPELNPNPPPLHPISDGPFRWTPPLRWTLPPVNPPPPDNPPPDNPPPDNPPPDNPPPDNPPPDRPKFRSFFSLLPPQFSFFFLSLGVLSWNFVGVLEGRNPEMCTFGLSGCRVKPRLPHQTGPPGLAHDSPRTPNVHI